MEGNNLLWITMRKANLSYLAQKLASRFGIKEKQILGSPRHKEVVEARFILMFILRQMGYSYPRIGRMLDKDHTTVLHGCRKVEQSKELKEIAEEIKNSTAELEELEEFKGVRYWGKWKKFFEIYPAKCQICGEEDIVEVHHKIPIRNGGSSSAENVLILCPTHHRMLHLGLLKIEKILPLQPVNKDELLTEKLNI